MVVYPADFDVEKFIASIRNHRKRSAREIAARNAVLRQEPIHTLLGTGVIDFKDTAKIIQTKTILDNLDRLAYPTVP